jgi:NodT family efflux transporter outer membrane factor (OMF) lipoprotein
VPEIPLGLPSTLLERRPDVAAAERRTAAANAAIGIARSAYFPRIVLSAVGGYETTGAAGWIAAPNRFWAVGPQAALTLFDAGARGAEVARSEGALEEAAARYRATVLSAFQEVADNLALLELLQQEDAQQSQAARAAERALELATNRYTEGAVSYLDVVVAQTVALQAERAALGVQTRELTASVGLVRGLGGGWTSGELPSAAAAGTVLRSSARP